MKRILFLALAFCLLCALYTPAFAASSLPGDTNTSINAQYSSTTVTPTEYSVDIQWGSLEFTYKSGDVTTWDPENLCYVVTKGVGEWSCASGADTVTITNHSNAPIQATISYFADTQNPVSGSIHNGNFTLPSAEGKGINDTSLVGSATLVLSNTNIPAGLTDGVSNLKIGALTVIIGQSGSSGSQGSDTPKKAGQMGKTGAEVDVYLLETGVYQMTLENVQSFYYFDSDLAKLDGSDLPADGKYWFDDDGKILENPTGSNIMQLRFDEVGTYVITFDLTEMTYEFDQIA